MSQTFRTEVARVSSSLCIILDSTFWSLHKWRIGATVGIVALQSLLIVGLVLERRRKRVAARSLEESEKRYRNVVETQTELICRFLPDSTLTFVNDAYCRYFGKNREELIGSKFVYLIPDNAQEMTLRHINSLVDNPRSESHEHQVIRPDGSTGWQQWENHVISRDGLVELQGIGRDITERKLAEEALSVSEEFNRRIVESTSDCVKVLDLDGNLIYMSEHGQRLLEVDDVESLLGTCWLDLWKGDDGQNARDAVEKARNGEVGAFRGFGSTLKGTPKWWHTVISPMRGSSGNVERLLAITRDATNQEMSINALQESEQRFAKAFRGNPQPMSLTTLNGGIYIDVNDSFLNMTGYIREEVIGKTSLQLNVFESPDHRRSLLVDPLTSSGSNTNFEMKFRTKSGKLRVLLASAELLDISG
jgi:PAS domain S-box-containing protein